MSYTCVTDLHAEIKVAGGHFTHIQVTEKQRFTLRLNMLLILTSAFCLPKPEHLSVRERGYTSRLGSCRVWEHRQRRASGGWCQMWDGSCRALQCPRRAILPTLRVTGRQSGVDLKTGRAGFKTTGPSYTIQGWTGIPAQAFYKKASSKNITLWPPGWNHSVFQVKRIS